MDMFSLWYQNGYFFHKNYKSLTMVPYMESLKLEYQLFLLTNWASYKQIFFLIFAQNIYCGYMSTRAVYVLKQK